jgi:transcription-repair coupling factor (superfamily II helicase)
LAELHQLRGRVGRHRLQAHAYFLLPRRGALTDLAERRLRAIEEYDQLGAGFRIALRDLELRGAGHLLGAKQSGHIADVGYDLYCRLLRKAVDELRKRKRSEAPAKLEAAMASKPKPKPRRARLADSEGVDLELDTGAVEIGLKVGVAIPEGYLDDVPLKIELYRKLAAVRAIEELEQLHEEVSDRFGPPPEELRALLALRALRLASVALGIRRLRRQDKVIILNYDDRALLQAGLHGHRSRLRWIEQGVAHLLLDAPHADDRAALSFLLEVFSAVDRAGMLRVRRSFGMVSETRRRPRRRRAGSN